MQKALSKLQKQVADLAAALHAAEAENKVLRGKVQFLMQRMFGRSSEKLDPAQMMLDMLNMEPEPPDDDDPPPSPPPSSSRRAPRERKPRIPDHLPTEDVVIEPDEVKADPSAYQQIGEEVMQELDVVPARYFRRRIIRPKYKKKAVRSQAPVMAALPPRLIEGGYASAGLLTDIIINKYLYHLPLYRQEQMFRRHGIDLSRKTMDDWVAAVANWLCPIYDRIRAELQRSGYLQVDETPVRFNLAEGGGSGLGYFWVYHHPPPPGLSGGNILFEWHTGRGASCLEGMLDAFSGTAQCDAYGAYRSYAKSRDGLVLAGCWAHARRYFFEAKEEDPALAGWFLRQIQLLYRVEKDLRDACVGPNGRLARRASESGMILNRIKRALDRKWQQPLPRSRMGKAMAYALSNWEELMRYRDDGRLEIDNNLVENAIRPTALGKKNWLFIGHPEAGRRSAIIYTILATCKAHGIDPWEYLRDVLSRLPSMKITEVDQLTPANWLADRRQIAA
jgi:transposase